MLMHAAVVMQVINSVAILYHSKPIWILKMHTANNIYDKLTYSTQHTISISEALLNHFMTHTVHTHI